MKMSLDAAMKMYDAPLKRAGKGRKTVMDAAIVLRHPTAWMCFFMKRDDGTLKSPTWYRVFSSHGQDLPASRENHRPIYTTSFKRQVDGQTWRYKIYHTSHHFLKV